MTTETYDDLYAQIELLCNENDDISINRIIRDMFTDSLKYGGNTTPKLNEKLSPIYEWMEGYTGGEGGGEHCEAVIKFNGTYYSGEWSYYSHEGTDFYGFDDTVVRVKPKQVMTTIYEVDEGENDE